jgi:hypothetical protein
MRRTIIAIGTWIAYHWPVFAGIAMVTISILHKIYVSYSNVELMFDAMAFISGVGFFAGWIDKLVFDATMARKRAKR